MRKSLLALSLLAATSAPVMAADYSDGDIHKNDYKWMQFNLMGAFNELPGFPDGSNRLPRNGIWRSLWHLRSLRLR